MINFDPILIEFVSQNWLTLTVLFTILKGLAKITPWAWDDSVVSLFMGVFKSIRENNLK